MIKHLEADGISAHVVRSDSWEASWRSCTAQSQRDAEQAEHNIPFLQFTATCHCQLLFLSEFEWWQPLSCHRSLPGHVFDLPTLSFQEPHVLLHLLDHLLLILVSGWNLVGRFGFGSCGSVTMCVCGWKVTDDAAARLWVFVEVSLGD